MRGLYQSNEKNETRLLVVMVCAGTHRSFVGNHVLRRCTPARWLIGATDVDRMREYALQTRNLTVKLKVWSATMLVVGDDDDWRSPGDVMQKGSMKLP
jgi:hypothetical protein